MSPSIPPGGTLVGKVMVSVFWDYEDVTMIDYPQWVKIINGNTNATGTRPLE